MPPRSSIPLASQRYIDSPIAQFIDAARNKIKDLKMKYPKPSLFARDTDPTLDYSHHKIDSANEILRHLSTLLKHFDNYQTPALDFSWLNTAHNMVKLQEKFLTKKALLFKEIKDHFPTLFKNAKRMSEKPSKNNENLFLIEIISQQLISNKIKYIKKINEIPGKNPSILFDEVVAHFLSIDYENITNDDLPQVLDGLELKLDGYIGFPVEHPMAEEFVRFIEKKFAECPISLQNMVPFLNPLALHFDSKKTIFGPLIGLATGHHYELIPSKTNPNYEYELHTHAGMKTKIDQLNFPAIYQELRTFIFQLLKNSLLEYPRNRLEEISAKIEASDTPLLTNPSEVNTTEAITTESSQVIRGKSPVFFRHEKTTDDDQEENFDADETDATKVVAAKSA